MKPKTKVSLVLLSTLLMFSSLMKGQDVSRSVCDSLGVLPAFRFYNLKGELFTSDSIKKGHKTVLVYFKTNCEFCLSEFRMIKHNISSFPGTDFILISKESMPELKIYDSLRQFRYFPQIRIVQDKEGLYRSYFVAHYTPSIHVYDKHGNLLRFSDGMLSKEDFLKILGTEPESEKKQHSGRNQSR
jgi:thioredoxin-related protein